MPDPLSKYSARLVWGFVRYLRWYLGRHFHSILLSRAGLPYIAEGRSLVIYSNHPSWWDPLLFVLLGDSLFPGRRGFGPMEAHSLERYAIFERVGAFGIDLHSARGGVTFLVQARRILADHRNILWLTAEGAFTDVRRRPVEIQQGLAYLARVSVGAVVLPLALEYPFWNESRPEALCRFGEPFEIRGSDASRTSAELNLMFARALAQTMEKLSQESIQRSPVGFQSLLKGSSGVGGVYDEWRRLRSWSRGKRFNASHEERE